MTTGNEQSKDVGALGTSASTITWTVAQTQSFEAAYQEAINAGQPSVTFEGQTYEIAHARALIMALVTEFERRGLWPITWRAGQ